MSHRFLRVATVRVAGVRHGSFTSAAFRGNIDGTELFPFPARAVGEDAADTLETLQRQVSELKAPVSFAALAETGVLGLHIPEERGGLGLPLQAQPAVADAFAEAGHLSTYTETVSAHASRCLQLITAASTPEQKGRYLPAMADGSMIVAWAADEASCGADRSQTKTIAAVAKDGTYTVDGTKNLIHQPAKATTFLTLAKVPTQTNDADGNPVAVEKLSWLMIAADAKGVTVNNIAGCSTVQFSNVVVPADCVMGAVGEGFRNLMISSLSTNHALAAAVLAGGKRLATICAADIASMPASSQNALSLMVAHLYALEAFTTALAANIDRSVDDSMLESALIVPFAASVAAVVQQSVASIIPFAVGTEAVSRLLDDVAAAVHSNSDADTMRLAAGDCGVEDYGVMFNKSSTMETMQRRATRGLGMKDSMPATTACKKEGALIEATIVHFNEAVERVVCRNGPAAKEQQLLISRLADVSMFLTSSAAAIARANRAAATKQSTAAAEEAAAAIWVRHAMAAAKVLCDECIHIGQTSDEVHSRLAADVCDSFAPEAAKQ
jgi:alkylation response protein AidB-like acyl-CoA dehydrogenase